MKIALFGRGKTGGEVLKMASDQNCDVLNFHSECHPTPQQLADCDVIISFIPGPALAKYLPLILEARKPVISGSTGYEWPEELKNELSTKGILWIQGHNFSLGMNLIHNMITMLKKAPKIFGEEYTAKIHEVHHTKKLDAPSGTALRWKEWLELPSEVTSDREGDVVGLHTLELATSNETITLTHNANNRGLFAAGALWAARYALKNNDLIGFHWFEDLTHKELL